MGTADAIRRAVPRSEKPERAHAPARGAARTAWMGELRHRLHKINKELGWFAKYGLGKAYVEEEAP